MESKSSNLIVFDLDETLIHSANAELSYPAHFTFDNYFVYERPFLRTFLQDNALNEHVHKTGRQPEYRYGGALGNVW
jgi:FMN phosphatase YigB (HAD superfamily)